MSTPINLNKARKSKARAEKRAKADFNSAKFGRTKGEKEITNRENVRAARKLDGIALETPADCKTGGTKKP